MQACWSPPRMDLLSQPSAWLALRTLGKRPVTPGLANRAHPDSLDPSWELKETRPAGRRGISGRQAHACLLHVAHTHTSYSRLMRACRMRLTHPHKNTFKCAGGATACCHPHWLPRRRKDSRPHPDRVSLPETAPRQHRGKGRQGRERRAGGRPAAARHARVGTLTASARCRRS